MPLGRFARRSPRAEEPPSPSRYSTIQANVRSMLNGGGSSVYSQPTVIPSPSQQAPSETVSTPKLPPLDFLRLSQDGSAFDIQYISGSDDGRSQETGREQSLLHGWIQSTRSERHHPHASLISSRSGDGRVLSHHSHLQSPNPLVRVASPLQAYHPADTAALEAQPQIAAADASVRYPTLYAERQWGIGGHTGGQTVAVGAVARGDAVDPETDQLAALLQRRRRQRKRQQGRWVRRRSERGRCFAFAGGRSARQKCAWLLISGFMLATTLALYLSLALTQNNLFESLHIIFILAILGITIFFCHALVRLVIAIIRGPSAPERRFGDFGRPRIPSRAGPEGFKPAQPIHVVLARDEDLVEDEITGPPDALDGDVEAQAGATAPITEKSVRPPPPAYGLWRSSVRVDPNLLHWAPASQLQHQNTATADARSPVSHGGRRQSSRFSAFHNYSAATTPVVGLPASPHPNQNGGVGEAIVEETREEQPRGQSPRPPSYMSDEGVEYAVEAAPRSTVGYESDVVRTHPALR